MPSLPSSNDSMQFARDEDSQRLSESLERREEGERMAVKREEALELVGNVRDVKLTGSEEVVLDLNEITILMKEVPREQLQNVRNGRGDET